MRLNLSSQIRIEDIPLQYYCPANEFELSALTRFEKLTTKIFDDSEEASMRVADVIANQIIEKQKKGENLVLGLPGGNSPLYIFEELVRKHRVDGLSFSNVIVFSVYEFYPLNEKSHNNLKTLKDNLLDLVDIKPENIHSLDGNISKCEILNYCQAYENKIKEAGGIDLLLLGLGRAGNVGVNIAGSSFGSTTRLVILDPQSRKEAINTFDTLENVPEGALTMGISTIMSAKQIVVIAWGEDKIRTVRSMIEGEVSEKMPASILQNHPNVCIYLDLNAAYDLTRISKPWLVTNSVWDGKLIRRAIVWLCEKLNKPILKLTNKDYQDNGLEELLALFSSAYKVNIRVFNELQHTITGWPGGKPDADDSNRPERANPFPKRVIVFSPHPDDDVISMGGTFKRLVDQGHEVYVAYQTSGNIAVGDEEVIRYVSLMEDVRKEYDPQNTLAKERNEKILKFLLSEKKDGDVDTPEVLFIKGYIRQQEAKTACRYIGLDEKRATFLNLPFYETGRVKKNPISEKDVLIVKDYIKSIEPHMIFVAGDLADPHGTHKVCLDAILAAIDECKNEEWLENCRIWMYRGAWAEWEIDHIEMAVPISPEELRTKRNAILKHQSQMESAPFLGNDERLFWQRSEERNKGTAEMFHKLGLASYEAIEAFVRYFPL